ncbi:hypothetical protein Vadar_012808 [Vaccinium darrowii]|uniref:Uncharacterized protein n=1 Tax=Vaccinium darrowii TaxID=229202 RepID=A0ACB7X097_9ERIC|nr:hypothetical protein Vadar_012808 [Vaccinium darrowii]
MAQIAAAIVPPLIKLFIANPVISAINVLPSSSNTLRGFPKKVSSNIPVIHIIMISGNTTIMAAAIDRSPSTAPSATDAYNAGSHHPKIIEGDEMVGDEYQESIDFRMFHEDEKRIMLTIMGRTTHVLLWVMSLAMNREHVDVDLFGDVEFCCCWSLIMRAAIDAECLQL